MDDKDQSTGAENIDKAPEHVETMEPIVDTEIEPETVATPTPAAVTPERASERGFIKLFKTRRAIMAVAGLLLLAVVSVGVWWFTSSSDGKRTAQEEDTFSASISQPKLGATLKSVSGTAEYSRVEGEWQAAEDDTQLEEGDTIRTKAESRAVVAFEDGSVARLDADTTVRLVSLAADDVKIEQLEGALYSRVTASERTYAVVVDGTSYEAMGTAFVTVATGGEKGVQVYQSSVRVEGVEGAVDEGKQYFQASSETKLSGKVTALDIDALADDLFVNWNILEDQADENFRLRLGILSKIKQRGEENKERRRLEAEARQRAERNETADDRKNAEREGSRTSRADRGIMTLSLSGDTLRWNYTGDAKHGYKLVYSKKSESPTFGVDDALHFSSPEATSGKLTKKNASGSGKYHVRVCAYVPSDAGERCVDYSNIVIVDL